MNPANTLTSGFWPPGCEIVSFCVSHTVCGALLTAAQGSNTSTYKRARASAQESGGITTPPAMNPQLTALLSELLWAARTEPWRLGIRHLHFWRLGNLRSRHQQTRHLVRDASWLTGNCLLAKSSCGGRELGQGWEGSILQKH